MIVALPGLFSHFFYTLSHQQHKNKHTNFPIFMIPIPLLEKVGSQSIKNSQMTRHLQTEYVEKDHKKEHDERRHSRTRNQKCKIKLIEFVIHFA